MSEWVSEWVSEHERTNICIFSNFYSRLQRSGDPCLKSKPLLLRLLLLSRFGSFRVKDARKFFSLVTMVTVWCNHGDCCNCMLCLVTVWCNCNTRTVSTSLLVVYFRLFYLSVRPRPPINKAAIDCLWFTSARVSAKSNTCVIFLSLYCAPKQRV